MSDHLVMEGKIKYEFSTIMWKHPSTDGWFFISLPKSISNEIRENLKWQEEGWGRMKAFAEIDKIKWASAIWFDTKMDSYNLPIKAEIRIKLKLGLNKNFEMIIWI